MRSTLSILGLYQWDDTIFENLELPEGLDASLAVDSILFDNAELEIMYTDPEWMKQLIGVWSKRELPVWERVYKAITQEYDPLENYNRIENWNQTDTGSSSSSGSVSNTNNSTDTHKVTGYNDGVLVDQSEDTGVNQGSGQSSTEGESTLQTQHSSTVKGNIGVTTSQQMLNQELDVASRTDIYHYISRSFKNRFCLMVY